MVTGNMVASLVFKNSFLNIKIILFKFDYISVVSISSQSPPYLLCFVSNSYICRFSEREDSTVLVA